MRIHGFMRQVNPTMQNLAYLLLTHTAGGDPDINSPADAMEQTTNTLRLHLGKLMGVDGFSLLLVRALTFARVDYPWLEDIQVERDGSLKGLHTAVKEQEATEPSYCRTFSDCWLPLLAKK
jgi:hypothetical protein